MFQSPLLEEPLGSAAPIAVRRRYAALVGQARPRALDCPLLAGCLYAAVVEHDVAGYVAGTTPAAADRRSGARLRITVEPEDFDTLAGVIGRHRQVDHDEVLRLRHAHPTRAWRRLARRLGCSLSTVKRHLRKERRSPTRPPRRARRSRPSPPYSRAAADVDRRPRRPPAAKRPDRTPVEHLRF